MTDDCIFCKIANRVIEVPLVHEDDLVVAFRDIQPVAPTHILVIPKQHIPDIGQAGPEHAATVARLFAVAADLARREAIDASGYRLVANTGPDAGQTVQHLHIHLLGGRAMAWPPG